MRTIIGNSGGLDSTYALWKLLSTTSDDVTVVVLNTETLTEQVKNRFDVRSFNSLGDGNSRSQRVQNILNWLAVNVRPCTVVSVDLDENVLRRGIDYPNNPQTAIVEWAIAKINANEADKVIVTTERENDGYSNGGTITTRAPGAIAAKNLFVEFATRGEISFMLLDSGYHQGVALREMPQALIGLTHSCDVQGSEPCGVCFKCSKRKFFAEAIASGKTDEEIRAKVASKSELADGRWRSMKHWIPEEVPTCRYQPMDKTWDMPSWPSSYKVP
jgi:7-cyano-7-deazaguanine synthase in queuosine biosynthesis